DCAADGRQISHRVEYSTFEFEESLLTGSTELTSRTFSSHAAPGRSRIFRQHLDPGRETVKPSARASANAPHGHRQMKSKLPGCDDRPAYPTRWPGIPEYRLDFRTSRPGACA